MKVTAVGCIAVLLNSQSVSNTRYIQIYNYYGDTVGGPYPINKTILDETGVFVRYERVTFKNVQKDEMKQKTK